MSKKIGNIDTKMDNKEENKQGTRTVKIDIDDIMDELTKKIIDEYGVEWNEVRYIGQIKELEFDLPALDNTLCNEVMPTTDDDGCGDTGGGCICGLDKGHTGEHQCKRCGEEW
jgi:hypothetical protein